MLLLELDQAWITCSDTDPGEMSKGPSKTPAYFSINLVKGRGELLGKERGLSFGVGDWVLDNDLERRLLDLLGLGMVNGLRCPHSHNGPRCPPWPCSESPRASGQRPQPSNPYFLPQVSWKEW